MTAHRTEIQMRFGDTDALGHINNARIASYVEIARLDFLNRLGTAVRSLILASLYIDFRRQILFGETIHAETEVEKLGNSSMTLRQTIFSNGERAVDVKSVVVYFDYSTRAPRPLTDEMRRALTPYLVASSG
jgi:acyl-CoA thioester hydrolase